MPASRVGRRDVPADPPPALVREDPPRRWGRALAAATVAITVAIWGYVVYLAVGPGRAEPPDRLADPAFSIAAEQRCAEALAVVARLPPAPATPEHEERAAVLRRANATFGAMLADLEHMAPGGEDGHLVRLWLADWRAYLQDRERFTARLATDPNARLLLTPAAGGFHITERIDAFAADNWMPSCASPMDV